MTEKKAKKIASAYRKAGWKAAVAWRKGRPTVLAMKKVGR